MLFGVPQDISRFEILTRYSRTNIWHSLCLTSSRWASTIPSCLWSRRIVPSLPGLRLTNFYRDASSALLQVVNQWFEFYLLTFSRFPLRKKEHKSDFGKNRTHDFRTSRCAGYLLDHSSDEGLHHYSVTIRDSSFVRNNWHMSLLTYRTSDCVVCNNKTRFDTACNNPWTGSSRLVPHRELWKRLTRPWQQGSRSGAICYPACWTSAPSPGGWTTVWESCARWRVGTRAVVIRSCS